MINRNRIITFLCAAFLIAAAFGIYSQILPSNKALAGQFPGSIDCRTGAATSTFSFMSAGLGTTTLACDVRRVDSIRFNIILAASSTRTRYRFMVEDSPNNIDWYARLQPLNELASTTNFASNFGENALRFASSTGGIVGGTSPDIAWSGTGTTSTSNISFSLSHLESDYIRLVFYLDNATSGGVATSTNGAIRAEGVTKETRTSFVR